MSRIGAYTPETARQVLQVVRYLQQSGFRFLPNGFDTVALESQQPIYVRNDSYEVIPPFACMQVTGTHEEGGQNYIKVQKPFSISAGRYLFNGPAAIASAASNERFGVAYAGPLVRVLNDGSSPSVGSSWGPKLGQWYLQQNGDLALAVGADDIGANVMRAMIKVGSSEVFYQYQLTTGWTGGIAIATRKTMDGDVSGGSVLVRDPLSIFSYQKRGDKGYMLHKVAEDKYYAIQAPCQSSNAPPPEDPTGACCASDEYGVFCFETTSAECNAVEGVYKGDGTTCDTEDCP